jgi:putative ubiquitin-RnfH superfamily antitoxin RatB of RatAB toxin-antitoxin module
MQVSVIYNEPPQQVWLRIEVPEDCTVAQAIERSGVLSSFPHIDLENQKVGVFGKLATLDAPLRAGDRVEIYRVITCDPTTAPRRAGLDDEE